MSPRSSTESVQKDLQAYETFGANYAPILCHDLQYLEMNQNELPREPRHLAVPSGVSKMISNPMVRLAQTMHLSYTDTNTVSKWTETRFDMTHVT
jgi:hypothetical protein